VTGNEDSSKLLAYLEFEFFQQGHHADPGYFLLRGLLPMLLLAKVAYARVYVNQFNVLYKEKYPTDIELDEETLLLSKHHLFNYAQALLQMIEKNDGRFYTQLTNEFQEYLRTDSYLIEVSLSNVVCRSDWSHVL
jgi:hypothetical protein